MPPKCSNLKKTPATDALRVYSTYSTKWDPILEQSVVKFEKESHFIEVTFYKKSVGREQSRIIVLNKILMTQKKTNTLFYLQLVPVPQAKFVNFGNNNRFVNFFTTFKNRIEVPFCKLIFNKNV